MDFAQISKMAIFHRQEMAIGSQISNELEPTSLRFGCSCQDGRLPVTTKLSLQLLGTKKKQRGILKFSTAIHSEFC